MNINPLESTAELKPSKSLIVQPDIDKKDEAHSKQCVSKIYDSVQASIFVTQRKQVEEGFRHQIEREHLLGVIAKYIRQSQDLETIFHRTADELRHFLGCDRVLINRLEPDGSANVAAESVVASASPLLGSLIKDPCFNEKHREHYRCGCIQAIEDIYTAGLAQCYVDLLSSVQVRANLVIPITLKQDLWGFLIAQQCHHPRQWDATEIDLLEQLASQLEVAIQQAELNQQVEYLKTQLELHSQKQAAELQYCINFESVLRRITEQIRDNFDETQILQAATEELARILQAECCQIELYSPCLTTATIAYEHTTESCRSLGEKRQIAEFPEIYQPLLQKQTVRSVEIVPEWNLKVTVVTQIVCPIFNAQGRLGNIWIKRQTQDSFNEFEEKFIQQVANECAIAIQRAKLYEVTQTQIRELEKLENLKQEFLRTLSHELKTPITSINLAAQTLESVLKQEGLLDIQLVPQLLQILHKECRRESKLISDLLTLTYLEAEAEPLTLIIIDLKTWLPSIVEPFREITNCQQQNLKLNIANDLPLLETDITDLERILNELLNNACKFTPAGGTITVSAFSTGETTVLSVSNSGVEIATHELLHIFEPFYRIPNNDPWKYGGTGLGLALVHKLVKHIGASINVDSVLNQTTFKVIFS
jgi:signal transduction histidine kinase